MGLAFDGVTPRPALVVSVLAKEMPGEIRAKWPSGGCNPPFFVVVETSVVGSLGGESNGLSVPVVGIQLILSLRGLTEPGEMISF